TGALHVLEHRGGRAAHRDEVGMLGVEFVQGSEDPEGRFEIDRIDSAGGEGIVGGHERLSPMPRVPSNRQAPSSFEWVSRMTCSDTALSGVPGETREAVVGVDRPVYHANRVAGIEFHAGT